MLVLVRGIVLSYPALSGVPYSVTAKKRLVNREMRILNGGPTAGLPSTAYPIVGHHHPCGMGLSPPGGPEPGLVAGAT